VIIAANLNESAEMDLKPCPFCGGSAEVVQIGNEATPKRGFEVRCLTWGCATKKRAMVIRQPIEMAREFAVAAWNRRAASAELAEAYEALARRKANGWELQSSIYEGFSTEIWADGRPPGQRTVAIVRDYQDALTIMAAIAKAEARS
jgi:Lar family restriction alleviation protein